VRGKIIVIINTTIITSIIIDIYIICRLSCSVMRKEEVESSLIEIKLEKKGRKKSEG